MRTFGDTRKLYNTTECYSLLSVIITGSHWGWASGSEVSAGTFFFLFYPVLGDWLFSRLPHFTVLWGSPGGEESFSGNILL